VLYLQESKKLMENESLRRIPRIVRESTAVSETGVALIFISRAWKIHVFHVLLYQIGII
jgi:hypothetical protein